MLVRRIRYCPLYRLKAQSRRTVARYHGMDVGRKLDRESIQRACDRIAKHALPAIMEGLAGRREFTPSGLAHTINGLGNYKMPELEGVRVTMSSLVEREPVVHIPQGDERKADHHPLQTFAYCGIAGVDPDHIVGEFRFGSFVFGYLTLKDVLLNTIGMFRTLNHRDLGHILIGTSLLCPEIRYVGIENESVELKTIVEEGMEAHLNPQNSVCRHVHLTEGLMSTAKRTGLVSPDEIQELYFDPQMGVLLAVRTYLDLLEANRRVEAKRLVRESELPIDDPHLGGHLLELAAFAQYLGYELTPEQKGAVNAVANEIAINALDARIKPISPTFMHIRRALSLLVKMEEVSELGRSPTIEDLSDYAVDFTRLVPKLFQG